MILQNLEIKSGYLLRNIDFDEKENLIYSKKNSVGKSTLLRILLYSMGYPVPSTKGLKFDNLETLLKLSNNNVIYSLERRQSELKLSYNDTDKIFILPYEFHDVLRIVFGVNNLEVQDNLLGVFYVDQEKGWTLLNRGKVIGSIRFGIEPLVRGLSGRECEKALNRLASINHELDKYNQMSNTAEYQKQLNELSENICFDDELIELQKNLDILKFERQPYINELNRINDLLKQNNSFKKYINSMKLVVCNDDGIKIPVNEHTLVGYGDNHKFIVTRKAMICEKIESINNKIKKLEERLEKDNTLYDVNTMIRSYDTEISKVFIDERAVHNVIEKLKKEKAELEKSIKELTKLDNDVIDSIHLSISKYASKIGIEETYLPANRDYMFTTDLKSLTGAIFYKIVFVFKLAYIEAVEKYTGLNLPIILDSPNGREVERITISEMMKIVKSDFSHHQIIIASIYKDNFVNANLIEIENRLFED